METGREIPQQAFETRQGNASKERKVTVHGWHLSTTRISSAGHAELNQAMQIRKDGFGIPRILVDLQQNEIFLQIRVLVAADGSCRRRRLVVLWFGQQTVFACGSVNGGANLTKALELVDKFVKYFKNPHGDTGSKQKTATGGCFENFVKEFAVHIPSFYAIAEVGTTVESVPVSMRQFAIDGEKERIAVAFRRMDVADGHDAAVVEKYLDVKSGNALR